MWFFQIFLYRFQAHGSICRNKLEVLVCSSLFRFAPVLPTYKVVFFGPQRGGFHPPLYSQSPNQDADLLVSNAKLLLIGTDRRIFIVTVLIIVLVFIYISFLSSLSLIYLVIYLCNMLLTVSIYLMLLCVSVWNWKDNFFLFVYVLSLMGTFSCRIPS